MTCREKLARMFKPGDDELIADRIRNGCPDDYGFLPQPTDLCDNNECSKCWDREIPETENKEKENKNMSDDLIEKAYNEKYGTTSASSHMYDIPERNDPVKYETCDLDYKAEYERLSKENKNLKCCNELYVKEIGNLRERLAQYRFIIKTVEAMCGRDILEEF